MTWDKLSERQTINGGNPRVWVRYVDKLNTFNLYIGTRLPGHGPHDRLQSFGGYID